MTNVAQNVKKVASKNLKKPKVAENSKSCQNSKKVAKISKVAEKLPTNLWRSLFLTRCELKLHQAPLGKSVFKHMWYLENWYRTTRYITMNLAAMVSAKMIPTNQLSCLKENLRMSNPKAHVKEP